MADPVSNPIVDYFTPNDYCGWEWDADEPYVRWKSGGTICHRKDLEEILASLQPTGWPDLEVLFSLIEGLKHELDENFAKLNRVRKGVKSPPFLNCIEWMQKLPIQYRRGKNRLLILHKLVGLVPKVFMPSEARYALDQLVAGSLDSQIKRKVSRLGDLPKVYEALKTIFQAFNDYKAFETFIQTGLESVPKPIGDLEFPDVKEEDLLEVLEQDGQTSGLAALTKHLLAAFHIPMQMRGANDMPLGGVSDITNKGALDRLLLSELANDDLTLSARLANNEALYLRREEPPAKIDKSRIVLIDTTIRMWGLSRAFAVSVALACLVSRPKGSPAESFALSGKEFQPRPLETKTEVIAMLQTLAPELHCSEGLKLCLAEMERKPMERIFITSKESLAQAEFASELVLAQENLDFIIAINRDGEMQVFQLVKGRRKLLKEAKLDIKKLLFTRPKKSKRKSDSVPGDEVLPAFVLEEVSPLRFPAPNARIKAEDGWKLNDLEKLLLTDDRRLLLWDRHNTAGKEIFREIEPGVIFLEGTKSKSISFLIGTKDPEMENLVYHYDQETCIGKRMELPPKYKSWYGIAYANDKFTWKHQEGGIWKQVLFDCKTEEMSEVPERTRINDDEWENIQGQYHKALKGQEKHSLNHGYSPLTSVKSVAIDEFNRLCIDGRFLNVSPLETESTFQWELAGKEKAKRAFYVRVPSMPVKPIDEGGGGFLRYVHTPDGSQICLDRRGFIHLRSSDPDLHEVTIITITDKTTAAWASDGKYTGSHYFLSSHFGEALNPRVFEHEYLAPILERIMKG